MFFQIGVCVQGKKKGLFAYYYYYYYCLLLLLLLEEKLFDVNINLYFVK